MAFRMTLLTLAGASAGSEFMAPQRQLQQTTPKPMDASDDFKKAHKDAEAVVAKLMSSDERITNAQEAITKFLLAEIDHQDISKFRMAAHAAVVEFEEIGKIIAEGLKEISMVMRDLAKLEVAGDPKAKKAFHHLLNLRKTLTEEAHDIEHALHTVVALIGDGTKVVELTDANLTHTLDAADEVEKAASEMLEALKQAEGIVAEL